jgi:hypothetical protein
MEMDSAIAWLPPLISMHRMESCRVVSVVASIPRRPCADWDDADRSGRTLT